MTIKYGICMEGNEAAFERALLAGLSAPEQCTAQWPYILFEIGTAAGETAKGIGDFLVGRGIGYWRLITTDIPDGWSYDNHGVQNTLAAHPVNIDARVVEGGGKAVLTAADWRGPVHFAFIDGCHGAPCAQADFEAVETRSVVGTVVVFHDSNPRCQGVHLQPHCQTGINVRQALQTLGLLTNSRHGWRLVEETDSPHGIAVFQRIA